MQQFLFIILLFALTFQGLSAQQKISDERLKALKAPRVSQHKKSSAATKIPLRKEELTGEVLHKHKIGTTEITNRTSFDGRTSRQEAAIIRKQEADKREAAEY